VPQEPHYLEVLYRDLALALGDAVWAFAKIEWLTYESLGRLSNDGLDELVGDVSFRNRTAILQRLIMRREASEASKDRAFAALKVVDKLAEERNVIVHNPWKVWVDLDQKEFMTEIQKYSNPGKKLSLSELRSFIDRATVAEIELREALRAL
jgi:hypothetical protein